MEHFIIRPAQPQDMEAVLALIQGLADYEHMSDQVTGTPEDMRRAMFEENVSRCLIAEADGVPVGYAIYFYLYSTFICKKGLFLEDLYLKPDARGKGWGKQLIGAVIDVANRENCCRMEWHCLDWNTPSQEFYKSLGAKPLDAWTGWRLTRSDIEALADG